MEMEGQKALAQEPIMIEVMDRNRNAVGQMELDPKVFDAKVKAHLLHETVVYQEARHRAGTANSKTRGDVRGSRQKPFRQKGTGRARAGQRGSPLWHGGGVTFGPKHRDFAISVPKKIRRAALKGALTDKLSHGRLLLLDGIMLSRIKTADLIELLDDLEIKDSVLVVIEDKDTNLELSARNVEGVKVIRAEGINVRDVLLHESLLMTKKAAEKIQEALR